MIDIELFSQERAVKMLVREERIKGTVEGLLEVGVPPSKVLQRIMSKYNLLDEEDAKWYLDEVSKSMPEVNGRAIRKLVERFRKVNFSDEAILESIMEIFDLSEEEAREYLEESKSGNNVS